ncbi:hypothetical protein [Desulfolutivibrio sp.]|uniref:hypothetical protein n=1 Tax=Desulfolutivibrio sp. TaxID=2773296 RepID=UPI002F9617DE
MNAIFQVIQNILRRKEQKNVCPHCGRPLPPRDGLDSPDSTGAQDSDAARCPSCGHPLSGGHTG